MLKIERDKVYLNGHGEKIRVVCVDNFANPDYTVTGIREDDGSVLCYTAEGQYYRGHQSGLDLVREVKEKKVVYLNVYQRDWCAYSNRKLADDGAGHSRTACIRVEYEEGQFDD